MKNILDNAMIPKKLKGFFVEIGVKSQHSTLRKKCPHSELFWSECGKMRTRITPNIDTYHAVYTAILTEIHYKTWALAMLEWWYAFIFHFTSYICKFRYYMFSQNCLLFLVKKHFLTGISNSYAAPLFEFLPATFQK